MLVLAATELIFLIVVDMGLFWICVGSSVDNAEMYLYPTSEEAEGAQGVGRGHSWDS